MTAQDVGTARSALQSHPDIDLVLTDVVLPGGESGADLQKELAKCKPRLPVCLMSGFALPASDTHALPEVDAPLLNKPFRQSELAEKIGSLLAQSALRA